ncbi:uncharacterized protein si:dkey-262k9.2 isoform X1 [Sebastes umbrosus]|uniref:uncharacterized protein si:dkey-262k9.2 isoform X1 n=2 Tax=Sebastes umbrosus TaxID=72105 RepID=UPI00189DE0B0|nr:uncharacterized protein si:dkey-262k9.2 isoform X1 [Sebastes umbrosus]
MAPTEHLKMMRLLFLCLLLLLPAATAVSEEIEGSADDLDDDDEDMFVQKIEQDQSAELHNQGADKTTGVEESPSQLTLIIIIVAVVVLTLSGAAIVTTLLVRRHMKNRERGIYFVPTEQDQKGAV